MDTTKVLQTLIKGGVGLLLGLALLAALAGILKGLAGGTVAVSHGTGTGIRVLALAVGVGGPLGTAYLLVRHLTTTRHTGDHSRHENKRQKNLNCSSGREELTQDSNDQLKEEESGELPQTPSA